MPTFVNSRWITADDARECARIDRLADSYLAPWEAADFLAFLQDPFHAGLVAERNGVVVGFVLYRVHVDKRAVAIVRLCVHRAFHRRRLGTMLLRRLRDKAQHIADAGITALVHEVNLPAQLFFKANGFTVTHTLAGRFDDGDRDGYLFELTPAACRLRLSHHP